MDCRKWSNKYSTDCDLKYQSSDTRKNYKSCVNNFLNNFNEYREPKEIPTQKIKEYLLKFTTINSIRHNLSAIKSFYQITVGMPTKIDKIPYPHKDRRLPEVIDREDILKIFSACNNLKHKAILYLLYGCGMRVGEVVNLKLENIKTNTLDIKLGKGRKDRIVPLPLTIKTKLTEYINEYNPEEYVFNGQFKEKELKYSDRSIGNFIKHYARLAGINRNIHPHLFRHSYATHNLENGISLPFIQEILGHSNPKTTSIYLHTSRKSISNISSPIDNL
jgi:site-specific recombinase XerD